jgi:hypothetical protein
VHTRSDSLAGEVRVTLSAGVELANELAGDPGHGTARIRQILLDHAFLRAGRASDGDLDDVAERFGPIAAMLRALPGSGLAGAVEAVNGQLAASEVAPSLRAHDGFPLHIHWTGSQVSFGRQVAVDVLMALAQTLCDDGTARFGHCAAEGCHRLFHDATKNRSRRFCSDPRCASRTHTAQHRARRQASEG